MRVALLPLLLALLPACADDPPVDPPALGPVFLTTWSDGAVAGDLRVYVQDADGLVRGGFHSGPDGRLTVDVGEGWAVTLVDVATGLRRIQTVMGVAPGDRLDLGDRRPVGDVQPETLQVAPLAPVDGAAGYTISVCGPTITTTPMVGAGVESTVYYRAGTLDEDGGALLVAEANGTDSFAVLDVADVGALDGSVALPPWQMEPASSTWLVGAPGGTELIELAVHSAHDCAIGGGTGAGPEITAQYYPGLAVEQLAATAWFRRDDTATSRAVRNLRAADLAEPILDLTDPPARLDDVAVQATEDDMMVSWTRAGDRHGDGVVVIVTPSPDTEWTLFAPPGATHLLLPEVPDVQPAQPQWTSVTLVDLDDVDGYPALAQRAGLSLSEPGWLMTGARFLP